MSLSLKNISKTYPGGAKAVQDFSLDIGADEFLVLAGPPGCGKSTVLRLIAGLEELTEGEIYIDGKPSGDVPTKERNVAMYFQNSAISPPLTVYENLAFGLKMRKVPDEVIAERVNHIAEILGLSEYLQKKPKALSGALRQRVAIGRSIVREAAVFLLDEPFSNLDDTLHAQMVQELAKLQAHLKTPFVYATANVREALSLGTRVAVMKDGILQQVDTPLNLYDHPANSFVADFIGVEKN